jgi:hypothetical protein
VSAPKLIGAVLGPAFKRPQFRPDVTVPFAGLGIGSVGSTLELAVQLGDDDTIDDWRIVLDEVQVECTGPLWALINDRIDEHGLDAFGVREALAGKARAAEEARAEERAESRRSA